MAPTNASMGWASRIGAIAEVTYGTTPAPGTLAALTSAYVFESCSVGKHGNIVERNGLRGTRSHFSTDTRVGPYSVSGTLVLEPTAEDLDFWLPNILGAAASGTTYALAETLPSFSLGVDRVAKRFLYGGCKVNRATFTGSQGGLLKLSMDIVGQSELQDTTAWPALTPDAAAGPYIFSDLALTLASTAREVRDFELVIDNALVVDRFMNSTTIVNAPEGDRIVTLKTTHAYATGNLDLYDQALAGVTGTLVLTHTNGTNVLTATFGILQVPAEAPPVDSRAEIFLPLAMVARKTGSTMELSIVSE